MEMTSTHILLVHPPTSSVQWTCFSLALTLVNYLLPVINMFDSHRHVHSVGLQEFSMLNKKCAEYFGFSYFALYILVQL